jgi:hypothetical protein
VNWSFDRGVQSDLGSVLCGSGYMWAVQYKYISNLIVGMDPLSRRGKT